MGDKRAKAMTPIEEMACWTEAIRKENRVSSVYEEFSLNPRKLQMISEKPNRMKFNVKSEDINNELGADLKNKLNDLERIPKQKSNFPLTSNQEFGWDADAFYMKKTWSHNKASCDETKYANNYFTMTRKSPYSNKVADK
mmetsp:Transcript_53423/g.61233  ORF Transcript_53423/g.61233 Transcript_53423/m.61233 type:complete len:140 (+) Transcript_53423:146-565(+)|eukprot:CAMPEP_0115009548 /NCGR_PEP_ID=MMETSP0216-20121206/22699_1 /TAXON_ID=223996 /ORGANISM="Protocruzia adherens, Strain Boccale" /LENGTH=139 /DNA_ID=CAMNT_0002377419 /DNA_START=85 /DNA_END=504 /DNA_ORIENTATION=-